MVHDTSVSAGERTAEGSKQGGRRPESMRRVVAGSMAGNVLEWFDFSSYAFFATYIGANFFQNGDAFSALMSAFIVYGVGYVARPLGALLLGAYGDLKGRKATLLLTVSIMAAGTFIIAFAPPVGVLGVGATILLCVGRLLQGFSAGGEIGGATSYLVEKAPNDRKIQVVGWLQATMAVSNILAAVIGVAITGLFSEQQVTEWAWRIPFIIGLLIIPVALYIRSSLTETEEFVDLEARRKERRRRPVSILLKRYWRHILIASVMAISWHTTTSGLIIFAPTYYSMPETGLGFSSNEAFVASLVGNIAMFAACLVSAAVAQRVGYRLSLGATLAAVAVIPLGALVALHASPSLPALLVAHTVICAAVGSYVGIIPSAIARVFPTVVRSTGTSVAYNLIGIVFAGMTPALMTWLTTHTVYSTGLYVLVTALVGLVALPLFLRYVRRPGDNADPED